MFEFFFGVSLYIKVQFQALIQRCNLNCNPLLVRHMSCHIPLLGRVNLSHNSEEMSTFLKIFQTATKNLGRSGVSRGSHGRIASRVATDSTGTSCVNHAPILVRKVSKISLSYGFAEAVTLICRCDPWSLVRIYSALLPGHVY